MDKLLKETAKEHGVDPALLKGLIEIEKAKVHLQRRRGAKAELRQAIEKHLESRKP
jgi:hypothetical protein